MGEQYETVPTPVRAVQVKRREIWQIDGQAVVVKPGEWVVWYPRSGSPHVHSDVYFRAFFRKPKVEA